MNESYQRMYNTARAAYDALAEIDDPEADAYREMFAEHVKVQEAELKLQKLRWKLEELK